MRLQGLESSLKKLLYHTIYKSRLIIQAAFLQR